jgi:hypothetical protein
MRFAISAIVSAQRPSTKRVLIPQTGPRTIEPIWEIV